MFAYFILCHDIYSTCIGPSDKVETNPGSFPTPAQLAGTAQPGITLEPPQPSRRRSKGVHICMCLFFQGLLLTTSEPSCWAHPPLTGWFCDLRRLSSHPAPSAGGSGFPTTPLAVSLILVPWKVIPIQPCFPGLASVLSR